MTKKICIALLGIIIMLTGICSAAVTQEDFTVNGVNFVTGNYEDVIAHFGAPHKKRVEDQDDPPMTYLTYTNLTIWLNNRSGQIVYLKMEDRDAQTARGVKVGGTSYKVIKEYGQPERQKIKGHMYYIYHLNADDQYRLLFDLTEGYVSRIIFTNLPDNP